MSQTNNLSGKRVILTGAGGGIGQLVAEGLLRDGARVTLADLSGQALQKVQQGLGGELAEAQTLAVTADITSEEGRRQIVEQSRKHFGGVDMLVNCAGISPFGVFSEQPASLIQKTIDINLTAPVMLTHAVLPGMLAQGGGHIVNIGSTFGSIGFAWFSAYSATKFGLRGFSQALRRELQDSGVAVTYIAPRAVKTAINADAVYEMAQKVKMNFDEPQHVAAQILDAIRKRQKERYIGFPESFFARLNSVLPGIVDSALKQQNRDSREFAARSTPN